MTAPSLQSLLFELILQRKLAETSLKSKDLLIVCAGNDLNSNEFANEIPKPLMNRFLLINFDEFVSIENFIKYAKAKNFDNRVIDYVLYKNSLFTQSKEALKQSTTPRSLEFLSNLIKNENDIEFIRFVAKSCLEENDSIEFVAFVELYEKLINIEKYLDYELKELEKLQNEELFIISLKLTDKLLEKKLDVKKYLNYLEKVAKIRKEFVLVCLKYISLLADKKLKDELSKNIDPRGEIIKLLEQLITYFNY